MVHIHETDADRAARQRAFRLAETGRFSVPHEVEQALIAEGWPNARRVMHGDFVSRSVLERCHAASQSSEH